LLNEAELKEILENHKLWLKTKKVGAKADLSGSKQTNRKECKL